MSMSSLFYIYRLTYVCFTIYFISYFINTNHFRTSIFSFIITQVRKFVKFLVQTEGFEPNHSPVS